MFGYVIPDKMNMFVKDFYTYKAYYCGLCKRIGKDCGQFMRLSTNYDMVFLDMICHQALEIQPIFNKEACILSPKKKMVVKGDELTDKIVDINTLLMYYKLVDDKEDSKKHDLVKDFARVAVVESKYKKAKQRFPELDKLFCDEYARLRKMEKEFNASLDAYADPFANMLRECIKTLLQDKCNQYYEDLFYNIGRWVYFIDAIDDIDKDFKNKEFNPFFVGYTYKSNDEFFADKLDDLTFLLKSCYNSVNQAYKNIKINFNEGVITNILWYGLMMRTEDVLGRKCECKKIRI